MLKRTNEEGRRSLWGFPRPEITWIVSAFFLRDMSQPYKFFTMLSPATMIFCFYVPDFGFCGFLMFSAFSSGVSLCLLKFCFFPLPFALWEGPFDSSSCFTCCCCCFLLWGVSFMMVTGDGQPFVVFHVFESEVLDEVGRNSVVLWLDFYCWWAWLVHCLTT